MLPNSWSYAAGPTMNTPTMNSSHTSYTETTRSAHDWRRLYVLLPMHDIMPLVAADRRASRHMVASMGWTCRVMW